ncbi:DUF3783 domain-containing protein [Niameybacter massiliensis]|uniref:DUF3783 domain-containing protein n=1 Tax=Holtiella tumoricola TaxID=3018743 RepID=A0AA42J366_9FIRM|nr:DUF3783 domain-containing protein [Holtiella tumoricola]MDA3734192.1 DUF3783 domain-containing protein [Holtiella tumoricola]
MSFEKMQDNDRPVIHARTCIMLYGFTSQELKTLKNIARLTGLSDQILVNKTALTTTVLDLLENNPLQESTPVELPPYKAIVFNNVASPRINAFIESLKKFRIARPLMATVTDTSIHWTFEELVQNLAAERYSLKNNMINIH